jgi:hypothetical protein
LLGEPERCGGTGNAAGLHDRQEVLQLPEFHPGMLCAANPTVQPVVVSHNDR